MYWNIWKKRLTGLVLGLLTVSCALSIQAGPSNADDRQVASGPGSFTVRGGMLNDSFGGGIDGRIDYLSSLINVHLFGTVDVLDSGSGGQGAFDNTRYGGGLALSYTLENKANFFGGISLTREMKDNFANLYLGGKLKLTDYALVSAAYGFGFDRANISNNTATSYMTTESVDWLKTGVVLVNGQGLKFNAYYYLTDPGWQQISGIEGEISYPVFDNLIVGINGSRDLTNKAGVEMNWSASMFLTFVMGDQKGSPVKVALDKNNPVKYPQILRRVVQKPLVIQPAAPPTTPPTTPPPSGPPISIFPVSSSVGIGGCATSYTVPFKVNGGVGPFVWNTNVGQAPMSPTTGRFTTLIINNVPNFCGISQNITVTVTDQATGQSQTATVNIFGV